MFRSILAGLAFIALAACSSQAPAQSTPLQGGPWTNGHLPMYSTSGNSQPVIQDSGPAGGGAVGLGASEQLLVARGTGTPPYAGQGTGPLGTNWCDYDAPITNATGYHYFCLSPNAQGGGLMVFGAGGAAAQTGFTFNINGTGYQFPFVVGGIVGPNTSVVNDFACWNNTTGTLLKDCGSSVAGSFTDNLTATGTNQGTALTVNSAVSAFTIVPLSTGAILSTTNSQGVTLIAGSAQEVINAGANPLFVYPPSGQSINGGAANAAVTIYPNASAQFLYRGLVSSVGAWYAR